ERVHEGGVLGPQSLLAQRERRIPAGPPHASDGEVRRRRYPGHSMTRSATARIEGGNVRPSAFAVFRLITSSNVVGCSIGRSRGRAPLRIQSTYPAARRKLSARFAAYVIRPPASANSLAPYTAGRRFRATSSTICVR